MRARVHSSSEREVATPVRRSAAAVRGGTAHALQRSLGNRIVGHAVRGGGEVPVPARVRGEAEARLGESLAAVRVRADSPEAVTLGAAAFTRGGHVHFAPGALGRDIVRGHPVLRHELEHVGQQRRGEVPVTGHIAGIAVNTDPRLEQAANAPGPLAAGKGPAGPAVAVAQLYTYNGSVLVARDQSIAQLKAVIEACAAGHGTLGRNDAYEVVEAYVEASVGQGGTRFDVSSRALDWLLSHLDITALSDEAQEFVVAENRAHAQPEDKAPVGIKGVLARLWERISKSFDVVDSVASMNALIKSSDFSDAVKSAEGILGPLGVALAAIGLAGNVKECIEAAVRQRAAGAALTAVGAADELGGALEFAQQENRWSAGVHLVRALIDMAMIAFGALSIATVGWASPALAVTGLLGLVVSLGSWIMRRRHKKRRDEVARTLWKFRNNAAVVAMLAKGPWGGFTNDDLSDAAGNESKFLREVSDRLTPA